MGVTLTLAKEFRILLRLGCVMTLYRLIYIMTADFEYQCQSHNSGVNIGHKIDISIENLLFNIVT